MKEPRLIGEIISEVLNGLIDRQIDLAFQEDWTDVTDILRLPCLRAIQLEDALYDGRVDRTKVNGRIYARNIDLIREFGTTDFAIKRRTRNGKK